MSRHRLLSLACLLLALATPPAVAHKHAPSAPPDAAAPNYATDPALRAAMDGVRHAVEAFAHARHGHMGPAQVRALADHLDTQVARVVRACRLAPQADASLHALLLTILAADRALRESPGDVAPLDAMDRALADYGRLFEDPGARAASRR